MRVVVKMPRRLCVLAAVVLISGALTMAGPGAAVVQRGAAATTTGVIAFSASLTPGTFCHRDVSSGCDLYLGDVDLTTGIIANAVLVDGSAGAQWFPALSADGRLLAYSNTGVTPSRVVIFDLPGLTPRLTITDAKFPSFSTDSARLYYSTGSDVIKVLTVSSGVNATVSTKTPGTDPAPVGDRYVAFHAVEGTEGSSVPIIHDVITSQEIRPTIPTRCGHLSVNPAQTRVGCVPSAVTRFWVSNLSGDVWAPFAVAVSSLDAAVVAQDAGFSGAAALFLGSLDWPLENLIVSGIEAGQASGISDRPFTTTRARLFMTEISATTPVATRMSVQGVPDADTNSPAVLVGPSMYTLVGLTTAPVLTTTPAGQTVTSGATVSFAAAANGSPVPAVRWQASTNGGSTFTDVSGAASTRLAFTASAGDNAKQFRAVFTNTAGTTASSAALLTVNGPSDGRMSIDAPANGARPGLTFTMSGWAADLGAGAGSGVDAVHVYAYPVTNGAVGTGTFAGAAAVGLPRADVGAAFGSRFTNSGYSLAVSGLAVGDYKLVAYARSTVSGTFNTSTSADITIAAPVGNPFMSIDGPVSGSVVTQPFLTGGWAVDLGAATGTGVDAVHVWAFPVVTGVVGAGQFVDAALIGGARADVGAAFGSRFTLSGFNFVMTGLSPGSYLIGVYAHSTVTNTFNQVKFAAITVSAPVANPRMSLDGPVAGTTVSQPFNTGGWAVDLGATSGSGVDAIHVWAFPVINGVIGAGQFVDVALLGGSRPDVGAVFGSQFANAGFNFLMTGLAPGVYEVGVYARSTVSGTFTGTFARVTVK